jgi:hypothetical protein
VDDLVAFRTGDLRRDDLGDGRCKLVVEGAAAAPAPRCSGS